MHLVLVLFVIAVILIAWKQKAKLGQNRSQFSKCSDETIGALGKRPIKIVTAGYGTSGFWYNRTGSTNCTMKDPNVRKAYDVTVGFQNLVDRSSTDKAGSVVINSTPAEAFRQLTRNLASDTSEGRELRVIYTAG